MLRVALRITGGISLLGLALSTPPLPPLNIEGPVTVSGISSGADFAVQFAVAYSDLVSGCAVFAGQAYMCASVRFPEENETTCAEQPPPRMGPGCNGLANTGPAPCIGCSPGKTVGYDHCKRTPLVTDPTLLAAQATQAENLGLIASLEHLKPSRVFLYRGTKDQVYLPGSVENTMAVFQALGVSRIQLQASVPTQHAQPTTDPSVPPTTCGVGGGLPGMENCGFDGAGAALQWFYDQTLISPAPGARADPANVIPFDQEAYAPKQPFAGLASTGYFYIPTACRQNVRCRLHVVFHGCHSSAVFGNINTSFVLHAGYAQWADANNIAVLFPQNGGFAERNMTAPTGQLASGCWDGYGDTGPAYAWRSGPQMVAIVRMLNAINPRLAVNAVERH